jgi:hypothetical protein
MRPEFRTLDERLRERMRSDFHVTLVGKQPLFRDALDGAQASWLNKLLAHRLYELDGLEYLSGTLVSAALDDAGRWRVELADGAVTCDQLVLRCGPDAASAMQSLGLSKDKVINLRQRFTSEEVEEPSRLWPAGWWSENSRRIIAAATLGKRVEHISAATVALATTFVSSLSQLLSASSPEREFRMTLHRVLEIHGELWLQQASEYRGSASPEALAGPLGRIFPIDSGLIGLAARLGRAISVTRENDFDRAMEAVRFGRLQARRVREGVRSIFAVPFRTISGVTMVLFMDSFEKLLFQETATPPSLRDHVLNSCRGFAAYLDDLAKDQRGDFRFTGSDFTGCPIDSSLATSAAGFASLRILESPVPELRHVTFFDVFATPLRTP